MFGVVDFSDTPGVDSCTDRLPVNLNLLLGPNNGKRKKGLERVKRYRNYSQKITYTEFTVVLDGFFVILLDIIRKVVHGDVIVFNVLHDLD